MALSSIKVLDFKTRFHHNPKTGKHDKPVDWVLISNINGNVQTWHRVKDLDPSQAKFGDEGQSGRSSEMEQAFQGRWRMIGPKYENWKKGAELPEEGTALASWPFISADEVRAFIAAGIRTVEEVAAMNDAAMGRVAVPAIRDKRKAAQQFLDGADKVTMQAQIEELQKQLAELTAPSQEPSNGEGNMLAAAKEVAPEAPSNGKVLPSASGAQAEGQTAPTPADIIAQSTPSPDAPKRRGRPPKSDA